MAVLSSTHQHLYMPLFIVLVLPWLILAIYTPTMCSAWRTKHNPGGQRLPNSVVQMMEKEMLRRLGLERRPESFNGVPEYMLDVFNQLSQDPDAEVMWPIGGRVRNLGPVSAVISHPLYDSTWGTTGQHYLTFNMSIYNNQSCKVDSAELLASEMRIHQEALMQHEWLRLAAVWRVPHLIDIHEVVHPHPLNPITRLVGSRVVSLRRGGWLSFDVSSVQQKKQDKDHRSAKQSPISSPAVAAHFLIHLKTLDGQPSPVQHLILPYKATRYRRDVASATDSNAQKLRRPGYFKAATTPQYLSFYRSKRNGAAPQPPLPNQAQSARRKIRHKKSKKRRKNNRQRQSSQSVYASSYHVVSPDVNQVCQLRKMYVDFAEIGWSSWILAPMGYNAGLCSGNCPNPLSDYFNASNHAIVQMIVNAINVMMAPLPSCVPIRLTRLPLLHLGSNKEVIYKTYDEMRAESCGCR